MEKELHKCSSATGKKIIPASSRNQCLINCNSPWQMRIQTFSHQHLPTPALKIKQKTKTMQIPSGSHFSHGSLKIFERSWQHGGKHDSATLGILVCWLCDSVMWEDSHGSGAGDRRIGSPCSAAHVLTNKKTTTTKTKICHCKAGTLQKFTSTQMPPGRWGMGDGSWGAVHQLATSNSKSGRPLKGWSVCPLGIWQ